MYEGFWLDILYLVLIFGWNMLLLSRTILVILQRDVSNKTIECYAKLDSWVFDVMHNRNILPDGFVITAGRCAVGEKKLFPSYFVKLEILYNQVSVRTFNSRKMKITYFGLEKFWEEIRNIDLVKECKTGYNAYMNEILDNNL